jgi:hypothetical protein
LVPFVYPLLAGILVASLYGPDKVCVSALVILLPLDIVNSNSLFASLKTFESVTPDQANATYKLNFG